MTRYSREQRATLREGQASNASQDSSAQSVPTQGGAEDAEALSTTGPVFFWREFEQPYGFLCQWYTSYFRDPDVHPTHVFSSAEQYMMYRKALVLASTNDAVQTGSANAAPKTPKVKASPDNSKKGPATQPGSRRDVLSKAQNDVSRLPAMILAESKPGVQKELARSVRFTPGQEKTWEATKYEVVVQGSYCKYAQNADLRAGLLATGDRELVEASPSDDVWGIGFAKEFAEFYRNSWGSNLLGKALVSVRERLRGEMGEVQS